MSRVQSSSSASTVGIKDTAGNSLTSAAGALNVNVVSGGAAGTPILDYNEITSVPIGLETTVLSYTFSGASGLLVNVRASGQNIGEIRVYKNGALLDKQYLSYMQFNVDFDFYSLGLITSDIISIKAVNQGQDVCSFNAKLQLNDLS